MNRSYNWIPATVMAIGVAAWLIIRALNGTN